MTNFRVLPLKDFKHKVAVYRKYNTGDINWSEIDWLKFDKGYVLFTRIPAKDYKFFRLKRDALKALKEKEEVE